MLKAFETYSGTAGIEAVMDPHKVYDPRAEVHTASYYDSLKSTA
ncbi:type I restriction endonuclease subunit R [Ralstonia solanacearum]|nr:type I restriction endonuclease subunit R [Ralstonia solanacearum]